MKAFIGVISKAEPIFINFSRYFCAVSDSWHQMSLLWRVFYGREGVEYKVEWNIPMGTIALS